MSLLPRGPWHLPTFPATSDDTIAEAWSLFVDASQPFILNISVALPQKRENSRWLRYQVQNTHTKKSRLLSVSSSAQHRSDSEPMDSHMHEKASRVRSSAPLRRWEDKATVIVSSLHLRVFPCRRPCIFSSVNENPHTQIWLITKSSEEPSQQLINQMTPRGQAPETFLRSPTHSRYDRQQITRPIAYQTPSYIHILLRMKILKSSCMRTIITYGFIPVFV